MLRFVLLASFALAVPLAAQTLQFDFDALGAKATSKTDVNLDGEVLEAARASLPAPMRGVQAVSIHAYEYAKAGDYPAGVLDALRKQVAAQAGWSRLLGAKDDGESVDIFVRSENGKIAGFLLIAAEAKEVAVIQASGAVELANLQEVVQSAIQFDLAALAGAAGK